jgi:hypothetical protein
MLTLTHSLTQLLALVASRPVPARREAVGAQTILLICYCSMCTCAMCGCFRGGLFKIACHSQRCEAFDFWRRNQSTPRRIIGAVVGKGHAFVDGRTGPAVLEARAQHRRMAWQCKDAHQILLLLLPDQGVEAHISCGGSRARAEGLSPGEIWHRRAVGHRRGERAARKPDEPRADCPNAYVQQPATWHLQPCRYNALTRFFLHAARS